MSQPDFEPLADESLGTFEQISQKAEQEIQKRGAATTDSFAAGNTLTGGRAFQNLESAQKSIRENLQELQRRPAVARVVVEDESGHTRIIYISRNGSLTLPGDAVLADYDTPIGRLAASPVGEEQVIPLPDGKKAFYVIEKTDFHVQRDESGWESVQNEYRHEKLGAYSIKSLRAQLLSEGDELDKLLEQETSASGVSRGIAHQTRTAMGLRDQPILDQFQDAIFRLPMDSQLIILGPPGTGKTTTLIKRLGQKLNVEHLDDDERRLTGTGVGELAHEVSWLMFTPSDLLKHYLKEAFSRERVPATNENIKT